MKTISSNSFLGSKALDNPVSLLLFFRSVLGKNRIQKFDLGPSFLILFSSEQNIQQDNNLFFDSDDTNSSTPTSQHSFLGASDLFFYNYQNMLHGILSYFINSNMFSHLYDQTDKTTKTQQANKQQKIDIKNTGDSLAYQDKKRNFEPREKQVIDNILLSNSKESDLSEGIFKKHMPSAKNTAFLHLLLPKIGVITANDENKQHIKSSNIGSMPHDYSQNNKLTTKFKIYKENSDLFQNFELTSEVLIKYFPSMFDDYVLSINKIPTHDNDTIENYSNRVQVAHDKIDEKIKQQEQTSNHYHYNYPVNSFFSKLFTNLPLFQLIKIFQKEKMYNDGDINITNNEIVKKIQIRHHPFISRTVKSFLENPIHAKNNKPDNFQLSSGVLTTHRGSQIIPQRLLDIIKLPGIDTSSIRIHTGSLSRIMNQMYNSEAITINKDIFFSDPSRLDFSSPKNLALLGHELVHIIQMTRTERNPKQDNLSENNTRIPSSEHEELETEALEKEKTLFNYFTSSPLVSTETVRESQMQYNDDSGDRLSKIHNLRKSSNLPVPMTNTDYIRKWPSVLPMYYRFFAQSSMQPILIPTLHLLNKDIQFFNDVPAPSRQKEAKSKENNHGYPPTMMTFHHNSLQSPSSIMRNDSKQNKVDTPMFAKQGRLDYNDTQNQTVSSSSGILPSNINSETTANALTIDYAMLAETVYKLIIQKIKRERERRGFR